MLIGLQQHIRIRIYVRHDVDNCKNKGEDDCRLRDFTAVGPALAFAIAFAHLREKGAEGGGQG